MPAKLQAVIISLGLVIPLVVTSSCRNPGVPVAAEADDAGSAFVQEAKADTYENTKDRKGVVLLSVNWGRAWGFCGFENVQLRRFAFDRMPVQKHGDEPRADLTLEGRRLFVHPVFVPHALLIDPGEYALTAFEIKAAESVNQIGHFQAGRTTLIEDGKPVGGSFEVSAGEAVYIGHFAPECIKEREVTIWRYYWDGPEPFDKYLGEIKAKYPFLDLTKVQFNLFRTTVFGHDKNHDAGLEAERAGDYRLAEQRFELVLSNARSDRLPDDSFISMVTYNLGRMKGYLCKGKEAEQLLFEALKLEEKVSGPESRIIAARLSELGRFYYDHSQFDRAVLFYSRAIPAVQKLDVELDDPLAFADMIEEYAKALENVGRPQDAQAAKQQAGSLRANNPGKKARFVPVRYNRSCSG